jgi:hypothetical protein
VAALVLRCVTVGRRDQLQMAALQVLRPENFILPAGCAASLLGLVTAAHAHPFRRNIQPHPSGYHLHHLL